MLRTCQTFALSSASLNKTERQLRRAFLAAFGMDDDEELCRRRLVDDGDRSVGRCKPATMPNER